MANHESQSPYAGLANKIRPGISAAKAEFESRPPELWITRGDDARLGRGIAWRILMAFRDLVAASTFQVLVDGIEVGQLKRSQRLKVQVNPGLRRIWIKTPLTTSNEITHEFLNGDRLTLGCRTKLIGILLFK